VVEALRHEERLKVSARDVYRSRIDRYIRPSIGSVRLDRLAPEHVHRLHDYVIGDLGLSVTTARGAHRVLSSVLADALREDKVTRNVCLVVPSRRAPPCTRRRTSTTPKRACCSPPWTRATARCRSRWRCTPSRSSPGCGRASATGTHPGRDRLRRRDHHRLVAAAPAPARARLRREGTRTAAGRAAVKQGGYCPKRHLDVPPDQEVRHVDGGLYLTRPKSKAGWRVIPMIGLLAETLRRYLEENEPGHGGADLHAAERGAQPRLG
jgi:hypothetical protein